ncbi:glycosyltransferase family 2 protein [Chitinivibrio alkaliphilus]|uniref:Superfamily 2 glycosyltransferase n=1 Tax=Chitinivibrio alkaliphilus ACht1 TaxID=1313304 RepID=U7D4U3_9BACT|nr:glycosyltransferase family 2 protein [Chitinivibrio alkaliphilus]ERP31534.1 superfamily 2 glycosyltransferase [Chitinivibrio alkaliphilus ACht1]
MITVVIPLFNEEASLTPLTEKIRTVAHEHSYDLEILFVDDGSTDSSLQIIQKLHRACPREIHYISLGRNQGKSAALNAGFSHATGDIIITMDADLQDDPAAIPDFIDAISEGWDVVSGWKQHRKDPFLSKNLPSKVFNRITSLFGKIRLHDFNCGFKAYTREAARSLDVYGERHRFLPLLAHWNGFSVTEIPVPHHKRKYGKTKFGADRFINGFFDLITLIFLRKYMTSPLHFFGIFSLILFAIGGSILTYFGIQWFSGSPLHVRPIILFAVTAIIVAVQFFSLGLLGELFIHMGKKRAPMIKDRSSEELV